MPYQVTMDRTLSETEIDRLIQSELNRRKYYTIHTESTNEEFIAKWKKDLAMMQQIYPTGRFRNIRWYAEGDIPAMNPDDPLGLEAHPTDNTCTIIFTSFCHPCKEESGETYIFGKSESMIEQIQNDWEMNGQTGDFRETLGLTDMALWNDNPATGENTVDILKRWSALPHEKGLCVSDPSKISLVPLVEFFKSIGVTHHGHFILGQKPKEVTQMLEVGTENYKGMKTINGKDRREAPSDFPWPWQYGMSDVTGTELTFVLSGYLNCEDSIVNGPEIIQDYGWPGTK